MLAIDIETYSSVDLGACGVRPYTESPDFDILLLAYKFDDEETQIADLTVEPIPPFVRSALTDPGIVKTAYNAAFERACLAQYLGEDMPAEQWQCSMVLAATLGLPGSLSAVGAVLGLDKQKIEEGKQLIRFFCKPNTKGARRLPAESPERWELFKTYCIRDVDVEYEVRQKLVTYMPPREERDAWILDQQINDRGVRLDMQLVENAIECSERYNIKLTEEACRLTGLENPNSVSQLKAWIEQREGFQIESLNKESLPEVLKRCMHADTKRVLQIRKELGKTSVAKYGAMQRGCCKDGRAHNLLQFYGANRTGRWAGRLIQVQNLPQNKLEDLDLARQLVKDGEYDLLADAYGSTSFVLSQLIRTAFIPSEGCRFIVADYSAIEARVIAWLAREEWVLEEFRGDGLIYEATASQMFGVPKEDIKKGGPRADLRSKGKVATLACGYQGGVGALIRMGALQSGIPEEELDGIVKRWRFANSKIVDLWGVMERAAISAFRGYPRTLNEGVRVYCKDGYLFIRLPSGRQLAYADPRIELERGFNKPGISYMGVNQETRSWSRQQTYGGKLVENVVQATARDCLRDAMQRLDQAGYPIVFHVHDEVIIDMPKGKGSLEDVIRIMSIPPVWAPELPLTAAGFECDFYQKD